MTSRPHPFSPQRTAAVRTIVLFVALAIVVGSAATARSQVAANDGGIANGTYTGGIYFKMDGSLDFSGIAGMTNRFDAAGDATLVVGLEALSVSGKWEFAGTGAMGGSGTFQGTKVTFSGSSDISANGEFSGTTANGRMTGTSKSEGQWTMDSAEGSFGPFPLGGPGGFDEPLTDLLNQCSQLLGKWDSEFGSKLEAEYRAQGTDLSVTTLVGYLILSDNGLIAEESYMADRLRDLAKRANSTLGGVRGGGDAFIAIEKGAGLLRDVETLQADIAALESDCPADKTFQNVLTLIAQDGLDAVLEGLEADPTIKVRATIFRAMARLGNGTGAIGSGATDTGRANDLEDRMEVQANEAFEEVTVPQDGSDPDVNEAAALAALALQQGWDLENSAGITGSDVLAVMGN
jgi:hypothetical protein